MKVHFSVSDNSGSSETKYSWNKKEVDEFREIVKSEKNLKSRLDDEFLLSCLRARKYNLERALTLLKNYYAVKRKYPHLFPAFDSPSIQRCLSKDIGGYLPYSDHLGRLLIVVKISAWDTSEVSLIDLISTMLLYGDLWLNSHLTQVNGAVIILNTLGLSIKHVVQATPRLAYQYITAGTGGYPVSYKEIHIVNVNYLFYPILSMTLPFLPSKIRKRMHLHTGVEGLHTYIPKKYLPSDLGGEMEATNFSQCSQDFRSNEDFFREHQKYWLS